MRTQLLTITVTDLGPSDSLFSQNFPCTFDSASTQNHNFLIINDNRVTSQRSYTAKKAESALIGPVLHGRLNRVRDAYCVIENE